MVFALVACVVMKLGVRVPPRAVVTASALLIGLIFLEPDGPDFRMTPFVYVPGSGTFFRENSCASGSAAAAMYLAAERSVPVSLTLLEPAMYLSLWPQQRSLPET